MRWLWIMVLAGIADTTSAVFGAVLLNSRSGLVFSAVTCTAAAALVAVAAHRGTAPHRPARSMTAVAVAAIALSYWIDLFAPTLAVGAEMRRGAGWVLWPSLAWSASVVIREARLQARVAARRK